MFVEVAILNLILGECLQKLASKIIGYSIVLTAGMIKMPQIMKIMSNKKADGVSLSSHILMNLASISVFTYSIAKQLSFSMWGESVALALQNGLICVLICVYSGKRYNRAVFVTLLNILFTAFLMFPKLPWSIRYLFTALNWPLIFTSKIIQIYTNFNNGGTGQLSSLSVFMMNFRSYGRLFTFIVETNDVFRMAYFGIISFLNTVLLGQMMYYTNKYKES